MRFRFLAVGLFFLSTWMLPGCGGNSQSVESSLQEVKEADEREYGGKTEAQLDAEEEAEDAE